MKYDLAKHKRRSIRLQGYDYSEPGAYFITIFTHQRQCLFGKIVAGQMELNATGLWVQACWQRLPYRFSHLTLDAFVIMPNHLHGILWLGDENHADGVISYRGEDTPCKGRSIRPRYFRLFQSFMAECFAPTQPKCLAYHAKRYQTRFGRSNHSKFQIHFDSPY